MRHYSVKNKFLICSIALLACLLPLSLCSADTPVNGTITGVTEWDETGSPYIVESNLTVNEEASLIINPGVEVRFSSQVRLIVNGLISVGGNGTDGNEIIFCANIDGETWHGIEITSENDSYNSFRNVIIRDCVPGIIVNNASIYMNNCDIHINHNNDIAPNGVFAFQINNSLYVDFSDVRAFVTAYYSNAYVFQATSSIVNIERSNFMLGIEVSAGCDPGKVMNFIQSIGSVTETHIVGNARTTSLLGLCVTSGHNEEPSGSLNLSHNSINLSTGGGDASKALQVTLTPETFLIDHFSINLRPTSNILMYGIEAVSNTNLSVRNTIICNSSGVKEYNCPAVGVYSETSSIDVWYCDFYNTSFTNNSEIYVDTNTLLQQDPCWVNTDTFNISGDSPCINKGDPNYEYDPDETVTDIGMKYYHIYNEVVNTNPANQLPDSFDLVGVYPNPFNNSASIQVSLPAASYLEVSVYDVLGRLVNQLAQGNYNAGNVNFIWNAETNAAGTYYIRAHNNSAVASRRVVLLK